MNNWYKLLRGSLGMYTSIFVRELVTLGTENIFSGPKIIVGNHPNATDGFAILKIFHKEHLHFAVMKEIFTLPFISTVFRNSEQIPVYKGGSQAFVEKATEFLDRGDPIVIFPEGRLNMNAETMHKAGVGAALLGLNCNYPILPVGMYVPEQHLKKIRSKFYGRQTVGTWQFGGKLFFNFGRSFKLPKPESEIDSSILRQYTNQIMEQIGLLANEAKQIAEKFQEGIGVGMGN